VRAARHLATAAVSAVLLSTSLAACGVGTDDEPQEISRSNVPEGILDGEGQRPTSSATDGAGEEVDVYFLMDHDGDVQLTARPRTVARPPTETSILEALLLDPPTESERAYNITTAIPSSTTLASAPERITNGVLVVDLSYGIFQVGGDDQRNAYAQIVCTATGIRGVRAVQFEVEGTPSDVFDGRGEATNRPLRCEDYASLLPDRSERAGEGESTGTTRAGE
jgi:spore germination protein GerM